MIGMNRRKFLKRRIRENIMIGVACIVLLYLSVSIYFVNHFFFNTVINGVDVSLKSHREAEKMMRDYAKNYKLKLIERDGEIEEISGRDIQMHYNEKNSIFKVYKIQKSFKWIFSLFNKQSYNVSDLYYYDKDSLKDKIHKLRCLNKEIIEPQNVSFRYSKDTYEVIKEVYGNKIAIDKLSEAIARSILNGELKLDLNENNCYINPKYILGSDKVCQAFNELNKIISAKIVYTFGSKREVLDKDIINKWLSVDEDLEVVIDNKAVKQYVQELSNKYDTVGTVRSFKSSIGKVVEVKGGFYGWKINCAYETKALIENIKNGKGIEKEPIYTQKALSRDENDIGKTYVEINITRQYLWFYKEGNIIVQGSVVTGNPNRGNSTKLGVYMINYKQKGSTLRGADYESEVTYWMPFNGNIGIHDASWRYSYGGNIYKTNGTHGCVNVSLHMAKKIFENIEEGTPVICYEEA